MFQFIGRHAADLAHSGSDSQLQLQDVGAVDWHVASSEPRPQLSDLVVVQDTVARDELAIGTESG